MSLYCRGMADENIAVLHRYDDIRPRGRLKNKKGIG